MHVGGHAHGAAHAGEAAVRRHQQAAVQLAAIVQLCLHALFRLVDAQHFAAADQFDVVVPGDAVLHAVVGCTPDPVVGYEPAQLAGFALVAANHHGKGRGAIENLGIFQRCKGGRLVCLDARPQPKLAHLLCRALRQRDFAAVKGGVFQRGLCLLLDHADAQAMTRQDACQTQSGRASAHNQNVEFHGHSVAISSGPIRLLAFRLCGRRLSACSRGSTPHPSESRRWQSIPKR